MATAGVDFFRVDRTILTRRLLVLSAALIMVGATVVGAHLMHRLAERTGHVVSLVGGAMMLAGLVLGFGTMAMLLFENVYLTIGDTGLLLHDNGREVTIGWDVLEAVDVDTAVGAVVFSCRGDEPVRFLAGRDARNVALRVEAARRKAAHGLLHAT